MEVDKAIESHLCAQFPEKLPQSAHTLVAMLQVNAAHSEVGGRIDKYRSHGLARDKGKMQVRITCACTIEHRHSHGHIAKCRKPHCKHMLEPTGIVVRPHGCLIPMVTYRSVSC